MAGFHLKLAIFIAMMVASSQFSGTVAQTRHVVGDAIGWTIPSGGAATYTNWASSQTFSVGDILVFNFANGIHDVAEVFATSYDPCISTNPISLTTIGPASLTLTTPGTHYYICTFTSHCQIGQKLTINVSSTGTAIPPSSTPTTPASPPTTTPTPSSTTPTTPEVPCPPTTSPTSSPMSPPTFTSGSITPPSPPGNGAQSFTAVVPITFLAIGLALLNI